MLHKNLYVVKKFIASICWWVRDYSVCFCRNGRPTETTHRTETEKSINHSVVILDDGKDSSKMILRQDLNMDREKHG